MRIGYVGLGNMGGPMCRNLVKGVNHEVVVHDLDPAAIAACTAVGARPAGGLAALAESSGVIFTSLPTPKHVEAVVEEIAAYQARLESAPIPHLHVVSADAAPEAVVDEALRALGEGEKRLAARG